ncbi:MAG TPA: hypothetical protein VM694_00195 [Polyangium sp.]|nr:hypothetical protein [Polyangium sp.]
MARCGHADDGSSARRDPLRVRHRARVAIRLVRDGDDRGALLLWQPASDATITGIVGPFGRADGVGLDGTRCTGCVTAFAAAPPSDPRGRCGDGRVGRRHRGARVGARKARADRTG